MFEHHSNLFFITVFFGFFAIMNPLVNMPIFISLVQDFDEKKKNSIALQSVFYAFIIIAVFCFTGKFIFDAFGITLPAFQITGGIIVFYIGLEVLQSKSSKAHSQSLPDGSDPTGIDTNLAVTPLAVPILAGPGTISTAMNFSANTDFFRVLMVITMFAAVCVLTYIAFRYGEKLMGFLGPRFIMVLGRLMGLILAVIGTEMFMQGVKGAIIMSGLFPK
ncbi:MAG: MarC family protein [Armatimonadota bacterium]